MPSWLYLGVHFLSDYCKISRQGNFPSGRAPATVHQEAIQNPDDDDLWTIGSFSD